MTKNKGTLRIVVADDHELVRRGIRDLLQAQRDWKVDQMVRRVLEMGARGYVLKSDMAAHLVQAVKDLANGKVSLTPKVSAMVLEGFLKGGESKQPENGHARPTPRETEIIRLLAAGKTNKQIAAELGITLRTVETHRGRIMMKMGLHSLTELIHYAIRDKIITTQDL